MSLLWILLGTAALIPLAALLGRRPGRDAGWVLAAGLLALAAALAVVRIQHGDVSQSIPWIPSLGVELHLKLDGLSFFFAQLVLVVGAIVLAYSARYLPPGRHSSFYALMTLFAAAMVGLVLADDIVLLYVMWEFTTVCSFLLIARSGPGARDPAIRVFLVTFVGGLALLTAVATLWTATGTTSLSEILASDVWSTSPGTVSFVAVLIAIAAFTKSAQFPFHMWLPDAMVAITPVSAFLHAAAMVKAGIYLLLRFSTVLHDVPVWNVLLVTVGALTALMGAVFALQRFDLKEILAYSTVSQLGFLVLTIGIGTTYAIVGAVVHTAAHALFKGSLFMAVGIIDHQTGTRDIRKLSGLGRSMPVTAVFMTLSAASMAGIPLLFGFISKEAMFKAIAGAPFPMGVTVLLAAVAVLAAALTFAYSARMIITIFPGRPAEEAPSEAGPGFLLPVGILSVAGLVLGIAGPLAQPLLTPAAQEVAGESAVTELAIWHGLAPELFMSLAVIALGTVFVLLRRPIGRALDRRLLPFTGVQAVEAFRSGSIALGRRFGDLSRSDAPARHLLLPIICVVVIAAVGLATVEVGPRMAGLSRPWDWILMGLVAAGAVLSLRARTRIALVGVVGVIGFTMALWFYVLGGADVALTQLMVEILTVVVIVLLLSRLPDTFHASGRRKAIAATLVGIASGLAATVATVALTGRRGMSPISDYLLAEGEGLTGGTNVVNTILVDFRALDTLGELTVLGVAGIAIVAALDARGLLPRRVSSAMAPTESVAGDPQDNNLVLRAANRVLGPVIVVMSVFFFFRGHNDPGGGFIAALIGGAGLSLLYLAAPDDRVSRLRLPYVPIIGLGVVVAVATGVLGFIEGEFLKPLHIDVLGVHLTSSLLFDLGVYLAVIGTVAAALIRIGTDGPDGPPLRRVADSRPLTVVRPVTTEDPGDPRLAPAVATVADDDRTRPPHEVTALGSRASGQGSTSHGKVD